VDILVRQRAQHAQPEPITVEALFALRAQADKMSALRSSDVAM
jgi:hypothetical protein